MFAPCPICKKAITTQDGAFPFCGDRCRKIDLGQWLGEGYRIPTEEDPATPDDTGGDGDES